MSQVFHVTGELTDSQHVTLDAPLPLSSGKVRIVVEELANGTKPDLPKFEQTLRARQAARGHVPRSKAEIDAYLNGERDSWDF